MLLLIVIGVASQLAGANGAGPLDDCPVDRNLHFDNYNVTEVLERFYKDLTFLGAVTDEDRELDYRPLAREMVRMAVSARDGDVETTDYLLSLILMLQAPNGRKGLTYLDDKPENEALQSGWPKTYYQFVVAEKERLLGEHVFSAKALAEALVERQSSAGVSMNRLERVDGLIGLLKLSTFNLGLDKHYVIRDSPNYDALAQVYRMFQGDTRPLHELRAAICEWLYNSGPLHPIDHYDDEGAFSHSLHREDEAQDDFEVWAKSKTYSKAILCEFARKLAILADEQHGHASINYTAMIDQVRRSGQPELADKLHAEVVPSLETNPKLASKNLTRISRQEDYTYKPFTDYFAADLSIKTLDSCQNLRRLALQERYFQYPLYRRQKESGISLDRLLEMRARMLLLWMDCFHQRLHTIYRLEGTESERELLYRHHQFYTSDRLQLDGVPPFHM